MNKRVIELILTGCAQIALGERRRSLNRYTIKESPMAFQNSRIMLDGVILLNLSMFIASIVLFSFDILRVIRSSRKKHRVAYDAEEIKVLRERDRKPLGAFIIDLFFELMTMIIGFGVLTVMSFLSQQIFDQDLEEFARLCSDSECDILQTYYWSKMFQEVIIMAFPLFAFGIEVLSLIGKILKYCMENGVFPKWMGSSEYNLRNSTMPVQIISSHLLTKKLIISRRRI